MKRGEFFARSRFADNDRGVASASLAIALEPRMMYDAAGAATAAAVAHLAEAPPPVEHAASDRADASNPDSPGGHGAAKSDASIADVGPFGSKAEAQFAAAETSTPITEIVFVDARLPDLGSLAARPGVEVIILDPNKDGISQVAEALADREDLTAIHFVGHGDNAEFTLGTTRMKAATLAERAGDIAAWSAALGQDADLMIWGCDVAAQPAGQALMDSLASLTGADIAASTDLTGSSKLGGDWELEAASGHIETASPFEAASLGAWDHLLDPPTISSTGGSTLTVAEPSSLNAPGADSGSLSGWQFGSNVNGNVTVTATVAEPSIGTLLNGSGLGTATAGGWTFTGTLAQANAWLDALTFKAADVERGNAAGKTDISLTISDAEGTTANRSIAVEVTPSNDPTILGDQAMTVVEGASSTIITPSVLAAIDPEVGIGAQNPSQVVYRLTDDPDFGYLTLNGQRIGIGSIFTQQDVIDGKLAYVHTAAGANQNAADGFSVSVNDGATPQASSDTARITLDITPVNQAPTVSGGGAVYEGQPANAAVGGVPQSVVGNFITADGGGDPGDSILHVRLTTLPGHGILYFTGTAMINGVTQTFNNHQITAADIAAGFVFDYAARSGLTYANDGVDGAGGRPPNDSFGVEVIDSGGGGAPLTAQGTIQLTIRPVNDDPTWLEGSTRTATVPAPTNDPATDYKVTLTPGMLNATDVDSSPDSITFIATSQTGLDQGRLVYTNGGTSYFLPEGATFTLADVQAGRIQYWQLSGATAGQTDSFTFQVVDNALGPRWNPDGTQFERMGGAYTDQTSAGALRNFNFTINLAETLEGAGGGLPDRSTTTTASTSNFAGTSPGGASFGSLAEGGTVTLTNGSGGPGLNYTAQGVDPSQVVYSIVGFDGAGPNWNGQLQKLVNGTWVSLSVYDTFTQADLNGGLVRFQHDGGEDFESSVRLQASAGVLVNDGQGGLRTDQWDASFTFYVEPVNDAPVASGSSTSVIQEGETVAITTGLLNFGDADDAQSEAYLEIGATLPGGAGDNYAFNNGDALTFKITSLPANGKIQYRDDGGNWHDVTADTVLQASWITAAAGTTRLRYVHDGGEGRNDTFQVQATDRWGATSNAASVGFVITNVNDAPQIAPQPTDPDPTGTLPGTGTPGSAVNNPLTVIQEGTYTQLTSAMLQAVDSDSSAEQVQYRITQTPSHGRIAYSVDGVTFATIGVGSSFTQADVAAGRIYYLSNGDEPGDGSQPDDSFTFTLADGAAEQAGNQFWIYVQPTNDAPVVTPPAGPIPVTDTLTHIPGFSVADPDLTSMVSGETDFLQVVVRLTHANGTPFTASDYAALGGIEIDVVANGATIDSDHDGSNDYLTLRGTRAQINAALASLTVDFGGDRDATYQVQVIADDRVRDVNTGALVDRDASAGGIQPGGNGGGTLNEPDTPFTGTPQTVLSTEYNWYADAAPNTGVMAGNIAAASVAVRASSINDPATLTSGNNAATTYEDQPTPIGSQINFTIADPESGAFGTPVTVTLTVPSGLLNVAANAGTVSVSGRDTGTLTLTGTAADIQALINASLTYNSAQNVNHDLNGVADGDVTLTVSFSDTGSNWGTGQSANNPSDLSIALTIVPVNDAPTVSAGSGTVVVNGPTSVPGFSVGDVDLSGDGGIAAGETDFIQVTVRITNTGGVPLSALQHQNVNISSTATVSEGATFEIDNTYDGTGSALIIRGTRDQVNAYLAGLQVEFTNALANSDSTYRVQVVADDRARNVATGALIGGADGGLNNNDGNGTAAVPTTAIDPYAAVPGGLTANVATNFHDLFPTDFNDPAHINLSGALITPEGTGSGIVQLGGITVTDSDALSDTLTATVTLPSGFTIYSVNGSMSYPGSGTDTVTITGTLAQINAALNSIRIQLPDVSGAPAAGDWNGQFDVTIVVNDGGNNGGRPASLVGDTNNAGSNPGDFEYADGSGAALVTTRTFTFTVSPVNDAPQVIGDGTEVLTPVAEDVTNPSGQTVRDLFQGQFGDPVDPIPGGSNSNAFAGVAVVGLTSNSAQGSWQYFNGTAWVDIGGRTPASALILGADTLVRFVPAGDFHGTPNALTARLVEDGGSVPATGAVVNLSAGSATGGTTRYSTGSVVLSTSITNVNDRPTLGNGTVPAGIEDTTNPGSTVGSLFGSSYSDATDNRTGITGGGNAATTFGGIAIVGNSSTSAQGTWQYSLDGNSWSNITTSLSDAASILLPTSALLRFVPAADFNGTPGGLTVRGADSAVSFAASADISATVSDQTSTWSVTRGLTITVQPRNDAPVLSGDASNPVVVENNATGTGDSIAPTRLVDAGSVTLSDLDLTTTPGLASGVFGAGTITVSLGASYRAGDVLFVNGALPAGINVSGGSNGTLVITLDGGTTIGQVQQIIEQIFYRNTSDNPTNGGADMARSYTITVADGNNVQPGGNAGGSSSLSAAPISGTITIAPTNDPPAAVNDVNAITEGTASVGGNVVAGGPGGAGQDTDPDSAVLTVTELGFDGLPQTVGTRFATDFGWLTLNADGTYTYELDNSNPSVNALKTGATLAEVFNYTIADSDGLTASATLTITINGTTDGTPAILPVDGNGAAAGQAEVHESGLPAGTDPSSTSEATAGTISVTAADGLASLAVGGTTITLAQLATLGATPVVIDTGEGILTLTGFAVDSSVGGVPTSGTLSYSYVLKAAQTQPGAAGSIDTIALTVTDAGGTSTNGTLVVRIVDDVPTARNDGAEVTEDAANTVVGNVVTGTGPNDTSDSLGADGAAPGGAVTGVSFDSVTRIIGAQFATDYGWLTLNADGSYSFQLDNSNLTVNALKTGDTLTEAISYTITDGDGDNSTATLTITIRGNTDGGPSIVPADGNGGATGQAEVYEHGLTDPSSGSETTTDSIAISAKDGGITSISVGGRTITRAELLALSATPITIDTGEGILTLTGFAVTGSVGSLPTDGTLTYHYELKTAQHQPNAGESADPIALTVTDGLGSSASGMLTVRIIDDVPVAQNDAAEITEDAAPNSVTGNVVTGAGPQDVADSPGADGPALAGAVTDLSFGGVSRAIGTRIATDYGWLTLNADGSYTYELNNSNTAVNGLRAGETLSETFHYTIADSDGDSSVATLAITVLGSNDGPNNAAGLPDRTNVDSQPITPVTVANAFSDVDIGDKLTYTATGLPPGLTLDPNTGLITGTFTSSASQGGPGGNGVYSVTITGTDEHGASVSQTFQWNVTNPPPVANHDTNTTGHDTPVGGNIITGDGQGAGRDSDPDGDTVVVTGVGGQPVRPDGTTIRGSDGGTFTVRADGSYIFDPGSDFQGLTPGSAATTTIVYSIVDADGATATATLTITVRAPAAAPVGDWNIGNPKPGADPKASGTTSYIEGNDIHRYTPNTQSLSQQMLFRYSGTQNGMHFYEARLGRDQPLPSWIFFDPSTQVVTAMPDSSVEPGIYVVRVIARDASGRLAESILTIHVLQDNTRSHDPLKLKTLAPVAPRPAPTVTPLQDGPSETPGAPTPQPDNPQVLPPVQPQAPGGPQMGPTPPGATPATPQATENAPAALPDATGTRSELPREPGDIPLLDGASLPLGRGEERSRSSLTRTLHGLGSTGRMLEAARILEELADESRESA